MTERKMKLGVRSWKIEAARELLLCMLSAILLILSFPRANFWILAWIGFVPLFFVLENKSKAKAFVLSYITGVIFWSGTIYWLIHVTLPGTILLILYLALYFGFFGFVFSLSLNFARDRQPRAFSHLLFLSSIWVLFEYIRSRLFTGFPWALLGYSQYLNLPVIQIADITGVWGVSFLVMMVNAAAYVIASPKGAKQSQKSDCFVACAPRNDKKATLVMTIFLLFSVLIYGYLRIHPSSIIHHPSSIKVSLIQGNIPQELKWDPRAKDYILDKYISLTREAALDKPVLIIWPEAANPALLGEDEEASKEIVNLCKDIKIPLLFGTVAREEDRYFNSALLIDGSGKISGRYDKLHLVPFGEYIPLKKFIPFLETVVPIGDITPGEECKLFKLQAPGSKLQADFSVLICFEDLFPELSRRFVKKGADFLINITNDAWYKQTSAPHQHLQASVFRAVENRIFLARAANTGVSGFIAPSGKIISLVKDGIGRDTFIDGYKTQEIKIEKIKPSIYTRLGDIFILLLFIFIVYGIFRLM